MEVELGWVGTIAGSNLNVRSNPFGAAHSYIVGANDNGEPITAVRRRLGTEWIHVVNTPGGTGYSSAAFISFDYNGGPRYCT